MHRKLLCDSREGVDIHEEICYIEEKQDAEKKAAADAGKQPKNRFPFAEIVWNEGQEMLIITTELTARMECAAFIAKFGNKEYFRPDKDSLLYERQGEIEEALKKLMIN